jgi:DNA-binding beta-propeller fold protein YncE
LTERVPSQTLIKTEYLGLNLDGGFYDAKDNLLILADGSQIDVVEYPSLRLKFSIPIATYAIATHEGTTGYSFGTAYLNLLATVYKFDPSAGTILGSVTIPNYLDTSAGPNGAAVSRDGKLLYVFYYYVPVGDLRGDSTPPGNPAMYIIDTDSMSIVGNWVTTYGIPSGLALAGVGSAGYYSTYDNASARLIKADLATGSTSGSLQIPNPNNGGVGGPLLSLDKSLIYLGVGNDLYVIDSASLAIVKQISLPNPGGISMSPDGRYLYITAAFYGYTILETSSLATVGTILTNYIYPAGPIFFPTDARSR